MDEKDIGATHTRNMPAPQGTAPARPDFESRGVREVSFGSEVISGCVPRGSLAEATELDQTRFASGLLEASSASLDNSSLFARLAVWTASSIKLLAHARFLSGRDKANVNAHRTGCSEPMKKSVAAHETQLFSQCSLSTKVHKASSHLNVSLQSLPRTASWAACTSSATFSQSLLPLLLRLPLFPA
eukprot:1454168-Pleurochrysis_carterae.AAC.1